MLQPHNYSQIQRRNLYDVAYRRTGAYKGMGQLPLCSSITLQPGFVGPVNCDPSQGGPYYPASQSQLADVQLALQEVQQQVSSGSTNWIPWAIGGGLLLVLLVAGRR